uniref:Uncharacterized protein n=1 Tax=Chromera velia CCMP2878 TaxID=1169474 RepID=A0A0K6S6K6_9ALVE|eukprot:Cvel_3392.t1-p1 / transcript=Cvel_3392.t1 / gene=Cvel_3392 / organism=Chromera_velia_CCMP2878 / gene_product=hypothetical protein / transcript_product=hypothetical protein / location=Cvel_scaffold136:108140-121655(-) / protein_length=2988 / sequence_SO=supercontig / SO=protein_coding / is_pseudo=false
MTSTVRQQPWILSFVSSELQRKADRESARSTSDRWRLQHAGPPPCARPCRLEKILNDASSSSSPATLPVTAAHHYQQQQGGEREADVSDGHQVMAVRLPEGVLRELLEGNEATPRALQTLEGSVVELRVCELETRSDRLGRRGSVVGVADFGRVLVDRSQAQGGYWPRPRGDGYPWGGTIPFVDTLPDVRAAVQRANEAVKMRQRANHMRTMTRDLPFASASQEEEIRELMGLESLSFPLPDPSGEAEGGWEIEREMEGLGDLRAVGGILRRQQGGGSGSSRLSVSPAPLRSSPSSSSPAAASRSSAEHGRSRPVGERGEAEIDDTAPLEEEEEEGGGACGNDRGEAEREGEEEGEDDWSFPSRAKFCLRTLAVKGKEKRKGRGMERQEGTRMCVGEKGGRDEDRQPQSRRDFPLGVVGSVSGEVAAAFEGREEGGHESREEGRDTEESWLKLKRRKGKETEREGDPGGTPSPSSGSGSSGQPLERYAFRGRPPSRQASSSASPVSEEFGQDGEGGGKGGRSGRRFSKKTGGNGNEGSCSSSSSPCADSQKNNNSSPFPPTEELCASAASGASLEDSPFSSERMVGPLVAEEEEEGEEGEGMEETMSMEGLDTPESTGAPAQLNGPKKPRGAPAQPDGPTEAGPSDSPDPPLERECGPAPLHPQHTHTAASPGCSSELTDIDSQTGRQRRRAEEERGALPKAPPRPHPFGSRLPFAFPAPWGGVAAALRPDSASAGGWGGVGIRGTQGDRGEGFRLGPQFMKSHLKRPCLRQRGRVRGSGEASPPESVSSSSLASDSPPQREGGGVERQTGRATAGVQEEEESSHNRNTRIKRGGEEEGGVVGVREVRGREGGEDNRVERDGEEQREICQLQRRAPVEPSSHHESSFLTEEEEDEDSEKDKENDSSQSQENLNTKTQRKKKKQKDNLKEQDAGHVMRPYPDPKPSAASESITPTQPRARSADAAVDTSSPSQGMCCAGSAYVPVAAAAAAAVFESGSLSLSQFRSNLKEGKKEKERGKEVGAVAREGERGRGGVLTLHRWRGYAVAREEGIEGSVEKMGEGEENKDREEAEEEGGGGESLLERGQKEKEKEQAKEGEGNLSPPPRCFFGSSSLFSSSHRFSSSVSLSSSSHGGRRIHLGSQEGSALPFVLFNKDKEREREEEEKDRRRRESGQGALLSSSLISFKKPQANQTREQPNNNADELLLQNPDGSAIPPSGHGQRGDDRLQSSFPAPPASPSKLPPSQAVPPSPSSAEDLDAVSGEDTEADGGGTRREEKGGASAMSPQRPPASPAPLSGSPASHIRGPSETQPVSPQQQKQHEAPTSPQRQQEEEEDRARRQMPPPSPVSSIHPTRGRRGDPHAHRVSSFACREHRQRPEGDSTEDRRGGTASRGKAQQISAAAAAGRQGQRQGGQVGLLAGSLSGGCEDSSDDPSVDAFSFPSRRAPLAPALVRRQRERQRGCRERDGQRETPSVSVASSDGRSSTPLSSRIRYIDPVADCLPSQEKGGGMNHRGGEGESESRGVVREREEEEEEPHESDGETPKEGERETAQEQDEGAAGADRSAVLASPERQQRGKAWKVQKEGTDGGGEATEDDAEVLHGERDKDKEVEERERERDGNAGAASREEGEMGGEMGAGIVAAVAAEGCIVRPQGESQSQSQSQSQQESANGGQPSSGEAPPSHLSSRSLFTLPPAVESQNPPTLSMQNPKGGPPPPPQLMPPSLSRSGEGRSASASASLPPSSASRPSAPPISTQNSDEPLQADQPESRQQQQAPPCPGQRPQNTLERCPGKPTTGEAEQSQLTEEEREGAPSPPCRPHPHPADEHHKPTRQQRGDTPPPSDQPPPSPFPSLSRSVSRHPDEDQNRISEEAPAVPPAIQQHAPAVVDEGVGAEGEEEHESGAAAAEPQERGHSGEPRQEEVEGQRDMRSEESDVRERQEDPSREFPFTSPADSPKVVLSRDPQHQQQEGEDTEGMRRDRRRSAGRVEGSPRDPSVSEQNQKGRWDHRGPRQERDHRGPRQEREEEEEGGVEGLGRGLLDPPRVLIGGLEGMEANNSRNSARAAPVGGRDDEELPPPISPLHDSLQRPPAEERVPPPRTGRPSGAFLRSSFDLVSPLRSPLLSSEPPTRPREREGPSRSCGFLVDLFPCVSQPEAPAGEGEGGGRGGPLPAGRVGRTGGRRERETETGTEEEGEGGAEDVDMEGGDGVQRERARGDQEEEKEGDQERPLTQPVSLSADRDTSRLRGVRGGGEGGVFEVGEQGSLENPFGDPTLPLSLSASASLKSSSATSSSFPPTQNLIEPTDRDRDTERREREAEPVQEVWAQEEETRGELRRLVGRRRGAVSDHRAAGGVPLEHEGRSRHGTAAASAAAAGEARQSDRKRSRQQQQEHRDEREIREKERTGRGGGREREKGAAEENQSQSRPHRSSQQQQPRERELEGDGQKKRRRTFSPRTAEGERDRERGIFPNAPGLSRERVGGRERDRPFVSTHRSPSGQTSASQQTEIIDISDSSSESEPEGRWGRKGKKGIDTQKGGDWAAHGGASSASAASSTHQRDKGQQRNGKEREKEGESEGLSRAGAALVEDNRGVKGSLLRVVAAPAWKRKKKRQPDTQQRGVASSSSSSSSRCDVFAAPSHSSSSRASAGTAENGGAGGRGGGGRRAGLEEQEGKGNEDNDDEEMETKAPNPPDMRDPHGQPRQQQQQQQQHDRQRRASSPSPRSAHAEREGGGEPRQRHAGGSRSKRPVGELRRECMHASRLRDSYVRGRRAEDNHEKGVWKNKKNTEKTAAASSSSASVCEEERRKRQRRENAGRRQPESEGLQAEGENPLPHYVHPRRAGDIVGGQCHPSRRILDDPEVHGGGLGLPADGGGGGQQLRQRETLARSGSCSPAAAAAGDLTQQRISAALGRPSAAAAVSAFLSSASSSSSSSSSSSAAVVGGGQQGFSSAQAAAAAAASSATESGDQSARRLAALEGLLADLLGDLAPRPGV